MKQQIKQKLWQIKTIIHLTDTDNNSPVDKSEQNIADAKVVVKWQANRV